LRAPDWRVLGVGISLWLLVAFYVASTVLIVVPASPLTQQLRVIGELGLPVLDQDWRLFAPELVRSESETILTVEFSDGGTSEPILLTRRLRDSSQRGSRRVVPSHLVRVLETVEINLNNSTLARDRLSEVSRRAMEGDPVAVRLEREQRFSALSRAASESNARDLVRYKAVVAQLAELTFPERRIARVRAQLTAVFSDSNHFLSDLQAKHSHLSELLERLESEIAESVFGPRIAVLDTGWFESRPS
jgi:hypothetical protein